MSMKKVRVTYEAIVPEYGLKEMEDILEDYDSLEDAVSCEGLDGVIDGSYEYTVRCEILDMEEVEE